MTSTFDDLRDLPELVTAARDGDETAWTSLVRRFEPLIASITRGYRLSSDDALDVSQTVWVRLVEHLARLREPRALPGWISTTASRACLDIINTQRRAVAVDPTDLCNPAHRHRRVAREDDDHGEIDAELQRRENEQAVRNGLAQLTGSQRRLLILLTAEPAVPYAQISAELGLPIGSIGPTRARYLQKLGKTEAVRRLTAGDRRPIRAVA